MNGEYILDENGEPKLARNFLEWAFWFETSHKSKGKDNRILHRDNVGEVSISTVFLGLDHNFHNYGKSKPAFPPLLWETMIFGGEMDSYQRRYDSRDDAIVGHMQAVEKVKALDADIVELERMLKLDGDYTRTNEKDRG